MAKLIMVWLFGAAVFTLGNVYAASPDRPTDEDTIGAQAKITLIQAILEDEDEDENPQDDDELQEDGELQEDEENTRHERDGQDDLEDEGDPEDADDQQNSPRRRTTPI